MSKKLLSKFLCLFFYHLGDMCCRLGDYYLYNKFMSLSIDIDIKNNLNIWKEKQNE
jgi:hypothetical protein